MKSQPIVPNPNPSPQPTKPEQARVKYDASGHGLVTELESLESIVAEPLDPPVDKSRTSTH